MHTPMTAPTNNYERRHFDKVALIDADRIKYLVCNDIYKQLQMNYSRHEIDIYPMIEDRLNTFYNQFSAKGMIFCFSGSSWKTHRALTAIEKEYKGNRKVDATDYEGKNNDKYLVMKYIMETNNSLLFSDLEADDLLCMLQTDDTFIYSNDKDLKQIPGWHFNERTMGLDNVDEDTALKNLCYQMIIGDTTDNICGIKGLGPKKAEELMSKYDIKGMLNRILFEYQMRDGITKGTDTFVENWNLIKLRMCRGTYFNQKYAIAYQLRDMLLGKL